MAPSDIGPDRRRPHSPSPSYAHGTDLGDNGPTWTCDLCTLINPDSDRCCAACGSMRDGYDEGQLCPQCTLRNFSDAQECTACGYLFLDTPSTGNGMALNLLPSTSTPYSADSSQSSSSAAQESRWTCGFCSLRNAPSRTVCEACSMAQTFVREIPHAPAERGPSKPFELPDNIMVKKSYFDPVTKCWRRPGDVGTTIPGLPNSDDGDPPAIDRQPKLGVRFSKRFKADRGTPGLDAGAVDERIDIWQALVDILDSNKSHTPAANPVAIPELAIELKPYQQQGVAWMQRQEASRRRGGILADEMGLGKTVQVIALLLLRQPLPFAPSQDIIDLEELEEDVVITADTDGISTAASPPVVTPSPFQYTSHLIGTLVVCPASVMPQWDEELRRCVRRTRCLRIARHHTNTKLRSVEDVLNCDVVLTTYATVQHEFAQDANGSVLFSTVWNRIVLDESQAISNPKSATAKAICQLHSAYRWCLTGTPVQNSSDDLYATFKFLRVEPWAIRQYWVGQVVKPFTWKASAMRDKYVRRFALVLRSLLLRRTKADIPQLQLPAKTVQWHELIFSDEEQKIYDGLWQQAQKRVRKFQVEGAVKCHIPEILRFLLRLRQVCSHPSLLPDAAASSFKAEECVGCNDAMEEWNTLPCEHSLCPSCLEFLLAFPEGHDCPKCHQQFNGQQVQYRNRPAPPTQALVNTSTSSTKLQSMLQCLGEIFEGSDPQSPDKVLIFTQWTRMLDIIQAAIASAGHQFARLDGSCNLKKRQQELDKFAQDPMCNIMLMSLKAGGVGLNITAANFVFLMDLWWNPAVEEQAIARAHRTSQLRPVTIHRFIIKSSIEQRILKLHEKKRACADSLLEGGAALQTITEAEIMELFAGC